jgi:hypothetical protein
VRSVSDRRQRFEFVGPLWLIEGLKQLGRREKKSMSALLQAALLEKYPELSEMRGGFLSRVLRSVHAAKAAGSPPPRAVIVAPGEAGDAAGQ